MILPPTALRLLLRVGLPVLLAVVGLIVFGVWLSGVKRDARSQGTQQERQAGFEKTINHMEKASNAAEIIRRSPDARRAECLRHARNPEDC